MKTTGNTRIFLVSFLDGFSFAGMFLKLRRPGAPTELFATSTEEEIRASGDSNCLPPQFEKH